jgi:hypothetical protein
VTTTAVNLVLELEETALCDEFGSWT